MLTGCPAMCAWRDAEITTTEPTAVRLLVSETPAATWEMALGPDDGPRLFIEQQIAGFDTDGATACFADAGSWDPLTALFERGLIRGGGREPDLGGYEDIDDGSMFMQRTRDEASGGELMSFATNGDGTYPVCVGRSQAGEASGVVVRVEGIPELLPERDGTPHRYGCIGRALPACAVGDDRGSTVHNARRLESAVRVPLRSAAGAC